MKTFFFIPSKIAKIYPKLKIAVVWANVLHQEFQKKKVATATSGISKL